MKKLFIIATLGALCMTSPAWADPGAAGGFLATVTYVNENCPQYRVLVPKTVEILHRLGQNVGTWGAAPPSDVLRAAEVLMAKLKQGDPNDVCARIWNEFGVGGETFPDTLARQ